MTDRAMRLLRGEPVDRTPLFPFILGFCAKNAGYPVSTIYSDPQKSFELQSWTHEQYGFDWGPSERLCLIRYLGIWGRDQDACHRL